MTNTNKLFVAKTNDVLFAAVLMEDGLSVLIMIIQRDGSVDFFVTTATELLDLLETILNARNE